MIKSILFLALSFIPAFAWGAGRTKAPSPDWNYVEKRLKKEGLSQTFIQSLKANYQKKDFEKVLDLNILLYLKKGNIHGPQAKANPEKEVRTFVKKNRAALTEAERLYGVHPELIASLLWLETRHGQNTGKFHVPSVYIHLLQAARPEVNEHLQKTARKYTAVNAKILKEIQSRTKTKSNWALNELKAIEKIQKLNKTALKNWNGSFSGAFGQPQFLPSSYLAYAKTVRKKVTPDLNRADDSIMSVANYLDKNGWIKRRPSTYKKALFRYNKSDDYCEAILDIAARASRVPASAAVKPKSKTKVKKEADAKVPAKRKISQR